MTQFVMKKRAPDNPGAVLKIARNLGEAFGMVNRKRDFFFPTEFFDELLVFILSGTGMMMNENGANRSHLFSFMKMVGQPK